MAGSRTQVLHVVCFIDYCLQQSERFKNSTDKLKYTEESIYSFNNNTYLSTEFLLVL